MVRWGRFVAVSSAVASFACFAVAAPAGAVAPTRVAVSASPRSAAARAFEVTDTSDVPPDDLTGAGATVPALFDPATATWTVYGASAPVQFGQPADLPAVVDPGGGAVAQIGVFRPSNGTWYNTQSGMTAGVQWGQAGDIPIASHYAGIGNPSTIAVYRPALKDGWAGRDGQWFIKGTPSFIFGIKGDIPVPGSYWSSAADDWATQVAIFRPDRSAQWFFRHSHGYINYGTTGDIPVPGDYDGNGTTDIAVYRPSTGTWFIRGQPAVHYGTTGDIPLTGDFTGDGHIDIAVYRPATSTWFIRGQRSFTFGAPGDIPVEAAPYHG